MTLEEKVRLLAGADWGELHANEKRGIPALKVTDGPHGVGWNRRATCFPTGVAMGSTWDPALIELVGVALGRETRAAGRHILLGPCINIHRTPLGGRNFESFGEDPYLVGRLAAAYVRGVQSQKVGACVKHFACNNQEWERTTISAEVDERTLREIYLPGFEAAVQEGGVWTVMGAYNKVNGTYCCENRHLLKEILKDEWRFPGCVMSDWGATHSTIESALAGLDLEMPGPGRYFGDPLREAVRAGRVPIAVVDDKVRRILRVMAWCGLLDGSWEREPASIDERAHQTLAQRVAEESIVLLKNEGALLPLSSQELRSVAVIGPNAAEARLGGGGSSTVRPPRSVSPLEGVRARLGERVKILFAQGARFPRDVREVPPAWLRPASGTEGGEGLTGEYFANADLTGPPVLTRRDATVKFSWKGNPPDPRLPPDGFSVRWTGRLVAPESGRYWLGFRSDDGARLYWDGRLLIDDWREHGEELRLAEVSLEAGRAYDIRLEYFEKVGEATIELVWSHYDESLREEAVRAARESDAALLFVGLTHEFEGEGLDRTELSLPAGQEELIRAVARANPRTVVVLINGTPVDMEGWVDEVPALLEAWYPGQEGGHAIARVLFGDVNPSGKLPVTFPKRLEDNPSYGHYPGAGGRVVYAEGIFVGYRYYDTRGVEPRFPFGHGLSYTAFEYRDLKIAPAEDRAEFVVAANVRNVGPRAGAEVVQLYVHDKESRLPRPAKELKGFEKIWLEPGEEKTVRFTLPAKALAFFDPEAGRWVVERGEFEALVGSSSRDIRLRGSFRWPPAP